MAKSNNNENEFGVSNYSGRINGLKRKIAEGISSGLLNRKYDAATNSFI